MTAMLRSTDLRDEHKRLTGEHLTIMEAANAAARDLTRDERSRLFAIERRLTALLDVIADTETAEARAGYVDLIRTKEPRTMTENDTLTSLLRSGTGRTTLRYVAREARTLMTTPDAAGGYTVPHRTEADIWYQLEQGPPMLRAGRIFATTGGNPLDVPTVANFGTAVAVSQGSAIGGTDPSLGVVTLGAHKVAQLLQVSRELLADSAADVEGFVAIALARNLEVKVGPWLTQGTGTTEPIGYLTHAGTAVTGGTGVAGRPTYSDLVDTYGALDAKYRRNAVWLLHDTALTAVRRMTDTSGAPIWAPAANGNPETLLGHPVVTDPYLPALGTASKSIVFGDPTAYAVRIADGGIDLEASRDYAFNQDLTTFRSVLRIDAAPLANDAFKAFRGGTA